MDEYVRRLNEQRFPVLEGFRKSLQKYRKYGLSEQDCIDGIKIPCDFFDIPMPAMIEDLTDHPEGITMFVSSNPESLCDDVICYNLEQLCEFGVTDKDTFTLVMTHECAHRVFQNTKLPGINSGRWESELIADFFIGVLAGKQLVSYKAFDSVRTGLANSHGARSHPTGGLRSKIISYAYTYVGCHDLIHNRKRTIQEYYQIFMEWLQKHYPEIREIQAPFYGILEI